jgi:hypothetical protein
MIMSDKLMNQQQQMPFSPYPASYGLAPINNIGAGGYDTNSLITPSRLTRNSGSLTFG